jgi:hypothetical protein
LQNTTLIQRLGALDVGGGLYECLIDRAQHSSLGFIGDLQQQRRLSLVWFSETNRLYLTARSWSLLLMLEVFILQSCAAIKGRC